MTSVNVPDVGSATAVDVRDSSSMRTKSERIASSASSSRMRAPVAATGEAGRDDGHAERLQRACDRDPLAAGERELLAGAVAVASLKLGTVSVRSSAAFMVTVTIMATP